MASEWEASSIHVHGLWIFLLLGNIMVPVSEGTAHVLSTVINENSAMDFVRFVQPPSKLAPKFYLTVEYSCSKPSVIGIEVRVWTETKSQLPALLKTWKCDKAPTSKKKILNVSIPSCFVYKPGHFNQCSVLVQRSILLAWILDPVAFSEERHRRTFYNKAAAKVQHNLDIPSPYELPEKPLDKCLTWWLKLQTLVPYSPICELEPEVFHAIVFPVALSGQQYGVHRVLPTYKNENLNKVHSRSVTPPNLVFTVSIWVYIAEYCPSGRMCSVLQRITWDDRLMTPLVYINNKGKIHFQVTTFKGVAKAFLVESILPKEQWCRITVTYKKDQFDISLNLKDTPTPSWTHMIKLGRENGRLWYNDSQGLTVFGGTEVHAAFKGYIGMATIYRRRFVPPEKIPFPDPYHPMFELDLSEREHKCRKYITWIKGRITNYKHLLQYIIDKKSCRNEQMDLFGLYSAANYSRSCPSFKGPRPGQYKFVHGLVRRWVLDSHNFTLASLGQAMFDNATHILEKEGLTAMKKLISPLKQASCYGNHDATYMLAVILSQGLVVKSDEIQSLTYLMYGAQDGHRLCLMALGNKHYHGLDGIPMDKEQAYVYFKEVADKTRLDREAHKESDVFTEHIRLTDDKALELFTEETGDLFQWFKHQAAQGVLSAQKDLARMMFWGSQGIKRDLRAAVEQYRIAAEAGDNLAQYDYGIVLLRGQGTEKNVSKALHYLEKSAAKGNHLALSALGWHALEIEGNRSKAAGYLERAHALGNPDASHNLGSMIMMGRHPNYTTGDKVKAFEYFAIGAKRGQLDSGIMVGLFNMRGHPLVERNPRLAADWARWVFEHNPALGKILAKGLRAYKNQNWPAALVYYMMSADTGLEVATFNLAHLCEENKEGLSAYLQKECVYKYYNLSTQRRHDMVHPYSYIKMGDYHWYGCQGHRDPVKAAQMYSNAASRGEPHAIFNLAFLVEEGIYIPPRIWKKLRLERRDLASNVTLLTALYTRCKQSRNSEAYLPCSLALWRIQFVEIWTNYGFFVKFTSVIGILVGFTITATSLYAYFHGNHITINTV